ncbi:tRNA (adenosine(37)-N6)-threonylcarbamoyltransferase complex dimerization subunit type 1 TsaB [Loktanella sp. S4079]|uniref:tRNA (adenosine(37)-N6)-threonylcarbamoyltransferase complex dimerization subunit type 1 TsaB n=1 Tax=Loktanella sp. S4079 TaxID=579483 RepID=UPI0005FA312D|nr:tRNA (adenosine(37)-N6)-threonylcarbamoyltransferase complex dimerization subunit type 1 TsaB [Loktanella sp. S4079]KJZ20817.1 peptidase M22 [Loktanella sp. S4079]
MQPNPTVIAFDTSAAHCAAALLLKGTVFTRVDEMSKGQAEHLVPMLEEMLREQGLTWSDLDAIGVGTGPGNFTGIRIAVAAARGLALGLAKPAIGVTGFEARAFRSDLPTSALIPAPRGQAYIQHFSETGDASVPELIRDADTLRNDASWRQAEEKTATQLIAASVQIAASRISDTPSPPTPMYVRPADAAPPRDQAPTILT